MLASLLSAFAAAGCSSDPFDPHFGVVVSFVQPYPFSGVACGDLQVDFTPIGVEPDDSPMTWCSDRPLTGEAGDVHTGVFVVLPGTWTATVSLRGGDCIGSEDFVKQEEEAVTVWVELSCK